MKWHHAEKASLRKEVGIGQQMGGQVKEETWRADPDH
jgi:hypothetical protein